MTDGSRESHEAMTQNPAPDSLTGRAHILWDNGSGTAAVWRLGPSGPEDPSESRGQRGAERHQFGPFAGWAARALAVGPDGRAHLLWAGPDGAASVWSVDMEQGDAHHREFGPYGGWEARALAVGPDGVLRVLWAGAGGAAALWGLTEETLREGGAPESLDCGPFAGWAARALAVGPDDRAHLLWTRDGGAASVWAIGPDGTAHQSEYGPYDGWGAVGVAAGPVGASRLLWRSTGGCASLWDIGGAGGADMGGLAAPDERPQTVHGPFAGWTPAMVARGADDSAYLLWRRDGGLASVWHLGGAGGGGHAEYGPYAGWVPVALALGPSALGS